MTINTIYVNLFLKLNAAARSQALFPPLCGSKEPGDEDASGPNILVTEATIF